MASDELLLRGAYRAVTIRELTSIVRWAHFAFATNYVHTPATDAGMVVAFFVLTAAAKRLLFHYFVPPLLEQGVR